MNTNGLAKHYDALNAHERFVLMEAAEMRNDAAELRRLHDAASRLHYQIADYTPFADSWKLLEMAYIGDQMYECAAFWQAFYLATRHTDEDRLPTLLFALGYRTITLFDGWAKFCAATQIPPPGTVQDYGGWPFTLDTIETARVLAFTNEQMCGWLADQHHLDFDQVSVTTAERVAGKYAEAYTQLLRQWGKA